ncbi:hypothetical protein E0Z10_g7615 [Xylaria hypoxylon]|uniref:Uncharacterized protein n=1 Tax=Xylaria hypoxylon TaxID=37992 RepID=A0A4Z0YNX8_9PEZI|nr:hypothetical protein E0Z10_g7615 [Xylaria hypoxylon]
MALQLIAAHAFSNIGSGNLFGTRDLASANAGIMEARADSGNDTISIFVDSPDPENFKYAASVVAACPTQTIYEARCTEGPDSDLCGSNAPAVRFTENASSYHVSTASATTTAGVKVEATVIENCELDGRTAATCTASVIASAQGQKVTSSATVTYTDAATLFLDVSITAGNDKLANPTGSCSAASGINTRAVAFWGFLGALGAVGVLSL